MPNAQTEKTALDAVRKLVRKFAEHESAYLSPEFGELSVRQEFIDDLLVAFGWDVAGKNHPNPFEREVRVERNVAVGPAKKRADYALFVKPNFRDVRLFVEAKRPTYTLATQDNYFQTARYGWSSGTPLAVLTDFREIHIIDCRYRPGIDSILDTGKTPFRYHYKELSNPEKFSELYWLISREAVSAGSIEKRAEELPKRRGKAVQRGLFKGGYQSIDDAFIEDLDGMREEFAKSVKVHNSELEGKDLTEITQRVLDRLVFLRFLEDKLIETSERVSAFGDKNTAWLDFLAASRRLDVRYNGVVFKPHPLIDGDENELVVDDHMFGGICERLADVNSPYDFNAIPIHILGSIYERFLGKIIETTGKRAKLVEKPEVRKAGGVYYTPEYVVRYIVEDTVGARIKDKTPNEIAQMRFADISCGSGSFLLGIYDCLLRYHTTWYNAQPEKEHSKFLKNDCIQHEDGFLHLTLKKRREILLNCIFGVDVDRQAAEVAQLSLYLKLLEDETTATARNYQQEMGIAILPSLSQNVVSGNSLVGTDVLDFDGLFQDPEKLDAQKELNPMDFEFAFRHVFKEKKKAFGFDVIVGNPPYVRPHNIPNLTKEYLWKKMKTFKAKSDLYSCFMERAIDVAAPTGGQVSFIVPHTWTSLESFEAIRRKLVEETAVVSLTQLPKKVFRDATVETCIFNCIRTDAKRIAKNQVAVYRLQEDGAYSEVKTYPQTGIAKTHLHNFQLYAATGTQPLLERLTSSGPTLGEVVEFAYGFKTADDVKFLSDVAKNKDYKPYIPSAAIGRYFHAKPEGFVWYRPDLMKKNKKTARPGEQDRFESEKLLVGRMGKRLFASYDSGGLYVKDAMLILSKEECPVSLKALLAIVNSGFLNFIYREFFVTIDVLKNALLGLPLPQVVIDDPGGTQMKALEKLVTQLMSAVQSAHTAKNERDQEFYTNRSQQLDQQIDELVEKLYGLNEDEVETIRINS
jgi:adenine-specific DNA-methyltransferase